MCREDAGKDHAKTVLHRHVEPSFSRRAEIATLPARTVAIPKGYVSVAAGSDSADDSGRRPRGSAGTVFWTASSRSSLIAKRRLA